MGFANDGPPSGAGGIAPGLGRHAQHVPRIGLAIRHEAGTQPGEGAFVDLEDLGDPPEEGVLGRVVVAIGERDVEQPFHQVAKRPLLAAEHRGDLAGVILETGHVGARHVEHPCGVGLLLGGMVNTSRKAATSLRVTRPSALAILAPSAITAIAKATLRSGGVRMRSKMEARLSPCLRAAMISAIRVQIDMGPP